MGLSAVSQPMCLLDSIQSLDALDGRVPLDGTHCQAAPDDMCQRIQVGALDFKLLSLSLVKVRVQEGLKLFLHQQQDTLRLEM